jgi:flagellar hook assembly protein FlgD
MVLGEARPNPTGGPARIAFMVAAGGGKVRIDVYDVLGRQVKRLVDGALPEGPHEVAWDGSTVSGRPAGPGLYFYRMTAGRFVEAKKILVIR